MVSKFLSLVSTLLSEFWLINLTGNLWPQPGYLIGILNLFCIKILWFPFEKLLLFISINISSIILTPHIWPTSWVCWLYLHDIFQIRSYFTTFISATWTHLFASTLVPAKPRMILQFFKFILYWSIADLQCHEFQLDSEGTQSHIYMYPFSPKLPSHPGCHVTLSRVPCAVQ